MNNGKLSGHISNHPFIFLISGITIFGLCLGGIFAIVKTGEANPTMVTKIVTETVSVNVIPIAEPSKTSTQRWTVTELPIVPTETYTIPTFTEIISTQRPVPDTKTPLNTQGSLEVDFVDVGQGDSILIFSPEGQIVLIDGGSTDSGLLQYLDLLKVLNIDTIIATHPHEDHIGGLVQVLEAKSVKRVITNGEMVTTSVFEHFLDAIDRAKAEYDEVKRGDVIEVGSLRFDVLSPNVLNDDPNHNSLVLRMSYDGVIFLFMGDADTEAETAILANGLPVKADILKVGHHGSCSSTGQGFLNMVDPDMAIISVGINNQYGLPCADTVSRLKKAGIRIFETATNGTIIVTVDPSGFKVTNLQKQELWRKP
jgi:competence protein ComEC